MSYKITVYFQDECIDNTYIYTNYFTYRGYYGDDYYSTSGLTFQVRFTANPASGCSFTRWVYRLGSTTGTVRYSYSNPFTYTGDQDIYIRAEGEYDEPEIDYWTLGSANLGTITSDTSVNLSIRPYTLYRRKVTFSESGTAKFYTEGTSVDTIGYLSTSTGWDDEYGEPSSYLEYDDDSNGMPNFYISYEVTANKAYYIWVRAYGESSSGSTTLYIEPPSASWTYAVGSLGTSISSKKTVSFSLSAMQMRRYSVSFAESGTATFYTVSDSDTYGYLSLSTATFNSSTGAPSSSLKSNDDSGDGSNFKFTYDVTAGTTYYVWVKGYGGASVSSLQLCVEPPEEVAERPNNFAWTYAKTQGGDFNLTASEWNALTSRINAFRAYKNLSNYSFTTAYYDDDFTATIYNQARLAIQGISGYGTYIPTVVSGQDITAYMMNTLVSELNAIP